MPQVSRSLASANAAQGLRVAVKRSYYLFFYLLFLLPLLASHAHLLTLPLFWDELGQFVPTALDLFRDGAIVAHSTVPNVHPPGVESYLALWFKAFGYSIPVTRIAMIAVSALGMLGTFLLSIELSKDTKGAPAFLPPFLLLVSPLFFTQSMMAQLDMPAMVGTLFALVFFVQGRYHAAAYTCAILVLLKETGIVTPAVLFCWLAWRRDWRNALPFLISPAVLGLWLAVLHAQTGDWLGNREFATYNVNYSLEPMRILLSATRRVFYLLLADFRWIGTMAVVLSWPRLGLLRSSEWRVCLVVASIYLIIFSLFGGAELERYLLPVLPLFYIAATVALFEAAPMVRNLGVTALLAGLAISIFWYPLYPFPFENNYSMVDSVRVQQEAAALIEREFGQQTIATAWPFSASLRQPNFGYVSRGVKTLELKDFQRQTIESTPAGSFDALATFTNTWSPSGRIASTPFVRSILRRYYGLKDEITPDECARLGLHAQYTWARRGQQVVIYVRDGRKPAVIYGAHAATLRRFRR